MARPSQTEKKAIDLASAPAVRVSRIRRDPAPKVKEKVVDPREVERRDAVIGITVFALAIFVIILAFGGWSGSTRQQQPVVVRIDE
jgi:hypothetical protein